MSVAGKVGRTALSGALAVGVVAGTAEGAAAADGAAWAACSGGGHSFQARIHWDTNGNLYQLDFKTETTRVAHIRTLDHIPQYYDPITWVHHEEISDFAKSSSYHTRPIQAPMSIGWHTMYGERWEYQVAIAVYKDGGGNETCRIHFNTSSNHFK